MQLRQPVSAQLFADAVGRHEHPARGPVEPLDVAPEPFSGQTRALGQIIGKLRVVSGGEADRMPRTIAARDHAQRAFGRYVDRFGREFAQTRCHRARARHGQPYLGIGRARKAGKLIGRHHQHFMAMRTQLLACRSQSANHTVHLRKPGVGNDRDTLREGSDFRQVGRRCEMRGHAASETDGVTSPADRSRRATSSGQ